MSALSNFDDSDGPLTNPESENKNLTYRTIKRFTDLPPEGIFKLFTRTGAHKQTVIFEIPSVTEDQIVTILDPNENEPDLTAQIENIRAVAIIRSIWGSDSYQQFEGDGSAVNVDIAFVYPDNSIRIFESTGVLTKREWVHSLRSSRSGWMPSPFTRFLNTFYFSTLVAQAIRDENIAPCPSEIVEKLLD